jgi:hypothetical protein
VNLRTGDCTPIPDVQRILEATTHGGFTDGEYLVRVQAAALVKEGERWLIAALTGPRDIAFWRSGMAYWTPPLPVAEEVRHE